MSPSLYNNSAINRVAELIKAGQKKEARVLLRDMIVANPRNLEAWELLSQVTYTVEEEADCLKQILKIEPEHAWARVRLEAINASLGRVETVAPPPSPTKTPPPPVARPVVHEDLPLPRREVKPPVIENISKPISRPRETPWSPEVPHIAPFESDTFEEADKSVTAADLFPGLNEPEPHHPAPRPKKEKEKKVKIPRQRRKFSGAWLVTLIIVLVGAFAGIWLYGQGYFPTSEESRARTSTAVATCQGLIAQAMQASGSYCQQVGTNKICYGNFTIQAELVPNVNQPFSQRGDIIDISSMRRLSAAPLDLTNNEWGIAVMNIAANLPNSLPGETVTMMVFGNTTLGNQSQNLETFYFYSELGQMVCEQAPEDGIMITMPEGVGMHFKVNGTELTLSGNASLTAKKGEEMNVTMYSGSGVISANGVEQYFGAGSQVTVPLGGPDGTAPVGPPSPPTPLDPDSLELACVMTGQFCSGDVITPVSGDDALETIQPIEPTNSGTATDTTPTPWGTDTPGPSPTPTSTGTITATYTPIPPTLTPTPRPTQRPSPTPVCGMVTASGLTISGKEMRLTITNKNPGSISVIGIVVNWIRDSPAQKLRTIVLGSATIWSGTLSTTPSNIPADYGWYGPASGRQIAPNSPQNLRVIFNKDLVFPGNILTVYLEGGCSVAGAK
jgi:hypothetical protein